MINYIDKKNTYIGEDVQIGDGTTIYPNVVIEGKTIIGTNCTIYIGSVIKDSIIGNNCNIYSSYIVNSQIGNNNNIGPFANIRENNYICDNTKIGSFVELKNSNIGNNTKVPHLSYIGDTTIGKKVNIGCGTVTANYDGKRKNNTYIGDNAFIGCNSVLVAPINIEKNSFVAAGSTITKDLKENDLAVARTKQINLENKNPLIEKNASK